MNEKRFRVRFEQEDGRGEIVNEKGVELNAREVVDLLNEQSERIKSLEMELDLIANTKLFSRRKLEEENKQLKKENEQLRKELKELENNYKDLLYDGGFDE